MCEGGLLISIIVLFFFVRVIGGVTDGCDLVLFLFVRMTGGSISDLVCAVVDA